LHLPLQPEVSEQHPLFFSPQHELESDFTFFLLQQDFDPSFSLTEHDFSSVLCPEPHAEITPGDSTRFNISKRM